jgi:predicted O-methyltransferase YrrM
MNVPNGLSMTDSLTHKALFGVMKAITRPRSTMSWVLRGHMARDGVFVRQTYWFSGTLPRVQLTAILPGVEQVEVTLPRAFDRNTKPETGASITVEEACHLAAIARATKAMKSLEIGTADGNTALLLASNMSDGAEVVTVDLPPDFGAEKRELLTYSGVELNLTKRDELGRQYRKHPLAGRVRQIYGDSAALEWSAFGGPFDLVFIDGCHSEAYVRSDTQNAMSQLAPGGTIVWHDYGMIPEVSGVVDQFAREVTTMKVYALEGTRLAVALTCAEA